MNLLDEDTMQVVAVAKELGFFDKTFLVTGSTGMIGKLFVNALRKVTDEKNIYVLGLDYSEASTIYGGSKLNVCSFDKLDLVKDDVDFIVHLASPTNPKTLKKSPVETISFIFESTKQILNFAQKHNSKVLYISSMEVFGEIFDENPKSENDLGYISLSNSRSSYPEAKRLCELLCYSYSEEYNLNVCIARLAQTFGAGTPITDPRIFGYLGRCAINKENIVLKTKGDSYGNYCYIADTLIAFLYILSKGISGETYNIVGDECRSTILGLATLVSEKIAHNGIKIEFDLSNVGQYPNPTMLNMSNAKLKSLGWSPKYKLDDMFVRMIDNWQK